MTQLPLNRELTVILTDSKFFPLKSKVRLIPQIEGTGLFVTEDGRVERPLVTGDVEADRFDGIFKEDDKEFRVLVEGIELGGRILLIGSIQDPTAGLVEAADTFVAEEEDPIVEDGQEKSSY